MNIQNLINPLLLLKVENNKLTLIETQNRDKPLTLQDVTITHLPNNLVAYSTDTKLEDNTKHFRNLYNEYLNVPSPLLMQKDRKHWINGNNYEDAKPINKRADGIIICRNENELSIIICDLKSDIEDCSKKFIIEKLFIDYIISILNTIFKENISIGTLKYVTFYLQKGLNDKSKPRMTKDSLQEFRIEPMIDYEGSIIRIPCAKTHKNEIKWEKIINF
jgi:hypothetical protein